MAKETRGRPTKNTEETRRKIEEATALDASIDEVAFYADISRDTYYEIIKKDKVFSDRLDALRNRPILKARQTVISKMSESYQNGMDYLSRKRKSEFSQKSEVEHSGTLHIGQLLDDVEKENGNRPALIEQRVEDIKSLQN